MVGSVYRLMNSNNNLLIGGAYTVSEEKIFGFTLEQIRKQTGKRGPEVDPEFDMGPINPRDTFLEPCIRGSQKILDNPEMRKMMYRIYNGIHEKD